MAYGRRPLRTCQRWRAGRRVNTYGTILYSTYYCSRKYRQVPRYGPRTLCGCPHQLQKAYPHRPCRRPRWLSAISQPPMGGSSRADRPRHVIDDSTPHMTTPPYDSHDTNNTTTHALLSHHLGREASKPTNPPPWPGGQLIGYSTPYSIMPASPRLGSAFAKWSNLASGHLSVRLGTP